MPPLLVNCHSCQREFSSEVRLTQAGIQGSLIDGVVYRCPHCGVRDPYFTAEHHLPSSGGFAAAHPAGPLWASLGPARPLALTSSRGRDRPKQRRSGS